MFGMQQFVVNTFAVFGNHSRLHRAMRRAKRFPMALRSSGIGGNRNFEDRNDDVPAEF